MCYRLGKFFSKIVVSLIFMTTLQSYAQTVSFSHAGWADSVLNQLTLEQKIAQLIMVRMHSNKDAVYNDTMVAQIQRFQLGGVCFFQSFPTMQAILTNRLQDSVKIPVMVAIDGEWGLGMRLDSVLLYPRQMALGAGRDIDAIYNMGRQIAMQCHRIGVHVNFAPDVDINNNPNNPVINSRSFGSDPELVIRCAVAYMKGMQDNGLLTTAKHFPGHGDTETDSHLATPSILHSRKHLENMELRPFQALIDAGADGIMIGHLSIPSLDSNNITTTSHYVTTELLKNQMGFKGLVFTDALEMKGIKNLYEPGELEVAVLIAGADMLLLPSYPQIVIDKVKQAVAEGRLSEAEIDSKCLNVLRMKEKYVLPYVKPIDTKNLLEDINNEEALKIYQLLSAESITLLENKHHLLPLKDESMPMVHIRIDQTGLRVLDNFLKKQFSIETLCYKPVQIKNEQTVQSILDQVQDKKHVIVTLSCLSQYPGKNNYGLTDEIAALLDSLSLQSKVILLVMGNPYCLNYLPSVKRMEAVMIAYHPTRVVENEMVKALAGQIAVQGRLSVDLNSYASGKGLMLAKKPHLPYHPSIDSDFRKIDDIVAEGLNANAFPGCQVLVAHKGQVIFKKAYGTYSYTDNRPVEMNTIYDLASLTKVMATTLAIMKLYDMGKLDYTDTLSHYLAYLKGSDKESMRIDEIMTHTAGLSPWIPFYLKTLNQKDFYHSEWSEEYSVPVCRNMYMKAEFRDSLIRYIVKTPLRKDKSYKYSDLGFYLLADLVQKLSGMSLDMFVAHYFYEPLALNETCFNPWQTQFLSQIAPTELDTIFRKQIVHGYVHDQGAALMGGVCGHAGLFSTAEDLAVILQMLLNGGNYDGENYLHKETIKDFTRYYYPQGCRRALGFDKPSRSGATPCGKYASAKSYGHSGFTGTFIWSDPQYDLIYIFLSNRVSFDANNNALVKMSIRTRIQDVVYQVLELNQKKK